MLTTDQIAELRRLFDAATPGLWASDDDPHSCDQILAVGDDGYMTLVATVAGDIGDDPQSAADQELIVALHNNAPTLLAAAERCGELEADAVRMREALKGIAGSAGCIIQSGPVPKAIMFQNIARAALRPTTGEGKKGADDGE